MDEYFYRKHLRKPAKFLLSIICFMEIIVFLFGALTCINVVDDISIGIITLTLLLIAFGLILSIELLLIYFILYRRFKYISISLADEGIVYKNSKGIQNISYDEIEKIKFPSIRYLGGWMKIIKGNKTIRLTVTLENLGDFINKLKDKLSERNMNNVYDERKLFNFQKTAVYADHSWARIYESFNIRSLTFIVLCILTLVFGCISNIGFSYIPVTLIIVLYPLISYIISEIIIGIKFSKKVKAYGKVILERDIELEKKANIIGYISAAIISIILIGIIII